MKDSSDNQSNNASITSATTTTTNNNNNNNNVFPEIEIDNQIPDDQNLVQLIKGKITHQLSDFVKKKEKNKWRFKTLEILRGENILDYEGGSDSISSYSPRDNLKETGKENGVTRYLRKNQDRLVFS